LGWFSGFYNGSKGVLGKKKRVEKLVFGSKNLSHDFPAVILAEIWSNQMMRCLLQQATRCLFFFQENSRQTTCRPPQLQLKNKGLLAEAWQNRSAPIESNLCFFFFLIFFKSILFLDGFYFKFFLLSFNLICIFIFIIICLNKILF
jgi:hypothetical protein